MARAGISGIGVISALGGDVPETMRRLFAPEPERLPEPPRRFETQLELPVFEIAAPEVSAVPSRLLQRGSEAPRRFGQAGRDGKERASGRRDSVAQRRQDAHAADSGA